MTTKLTEAQQKTFMELQRRVMDIQSKKAALKGQHASITMDLSSAETTLSYLQQQKDETVVYYAVGRLFVKHSMKEAREGHTDGVKQLSASVAQLDKALAAVDKQAQEAQSNLVDFVKTNNIPVQFR
jgi:chaperonin cofactor prefoldin